MSASRALVIGAGVGGLTAAAALGARGWQVTVLERVPVLEPVGAGIAVAPNALRALDVIGLGDAVRERRSWTGEGGLRTPSGRWLVRTTGDKAAERFGDPVVLLTRAGLVGLLRSRLGEGVTLRTGTPAELTDPGDRDRPATVRTEDGEELTADLVVGADGIRSATRRTLFPAHPGPRYAGFTSWRFLTAAPDEPVAAHETWGRGQLWGTQPLNDGRVYAYAAAALPEGLRAPDDERAELIRLFGTWHRPLPQLLADVPPEAVLRNDVHHMTAPLPAHHRGRAVLIGDAAHAMTPNAGQGGNQAIEDAIVLGQLADPARDVPEALAAHTRARLARTHAVVRHSARTSRLTMLRGGPFRVLRDLLLGGVSRIAPHAPLRALDGIADWHPPPRTYASQSRPSAQQYGQPRQAGGDRTREDRSWP